ncbi:MAG: hypothetical protein H0W47_11445 [Polaromonas sp.]|uniref:hypothetical protein n=1 Tax=Polaromonas sp. TaxID=1869339 RepID=UPI0017C133E1|nr:hypothetical protein [Polaromonas sp.]MBA3594396.1 hypothetical protein [Polaromonas sp.]
MNDTNLKQHDDEPVQKKRTWLRTSLFVIFLWIPLTLAGGNMVLGLAGVCVSPLSYLTKDELIEIAVRERAKAEFQYEGRLWREMAIEDSEPSIQKFLRDNPRCCDARRTGGLLELLAGWSVSQVEVNYERNQDRPPLRKDRYYQIFIAINSCGKVLESGSGMSSETLETTNYIRK